MWNLEKWCGQTLQSKSRNTDVENKQMDATEGGGGINWEIRIRIHT